MTVTDRPPAAAPSLAPRRQARGRATGRRRAQAAPYLLLAPAVVALGIFLIYPVVRVILTSFQQLGLRELVTGTTTWVGLDNYRSMLTDGVFWSVALRTVIFTAVCVVATMTFGLLIAVLMRVLAAPVRVALQACMVLAWATPIVATTTVFQWLFDENFGIVDKTLARLGFSSMAHHAWFSSGPSAFFVIVLLIVWQAVPFVAFSLYAALLAVPDELSEAAQVDGAGALRTLWSVHWPAIRPLFGMLAFLSVIWDFKVFTQVYVIRNGGPSGETTTLSVYQYTEGIAHSSFGRAAAVSVFMIVVLVVVSAQYMRLLLRSQETL